MSQGSVHTATTLYFVRHTFRITAIILLTIACLWNATAQVYTFSQIKEHFFRERPQTGDLTIREESFGSGDWVHLGGFDFPAGSEVEVTVTHTGPTSEGSLLVVDAVKFVYIEGTGIVEDSDPLIPEQCFLSQNAPNPFNASTSIGFGIAQESRVRIRLYDILGREVMVIIDEITSAGIHRVAFDASRLHSGVYYYQMTAGRFVMTRKILLIQ